jgi:hypothetical protein
MNSESKYGSELGTPGIDMCVCMFSTTFDLDHGSHKYPQICKRDPARFKFDAILEKGDFDLT